HHQAGDVVGQVRLGDFGAHRDIPTDDQAELDLVVQEPDVLGLDDVVERSADGRRRLAKECERDGLWVHAGVLDVRDEVRHLSDDATWGGHGGDQVEAVYGDGGDAVRGGVDG